MWDSGLVPPAGPGAAGRYQTPAAAAFSSDELQETDFRLSAADYSVLLCERCTNETADPVFSSNSVFVLLPAVN